MINAKIAAYSIGPNGDKLLSILATFPRIILAEVNTHRMLSKNTSSSRAIPFFKMIDSIINNPFIPIAWQTHHKGMQGSEYISMDNIITVPEFLDDFIILLENQAKEDKVELSKEYYSVIYSLRTTFESLFWKYRSEDDIEIVSYTIKDFWLKIRDIIVLAASTMYTIGKVSKQICNRLLEPFMWTTMLITGPIEQGWDNFFNLRCPQYTIPYIDINDNYKSWKDMVYVGKHKISNTEYNDINLAENHFNKFSILEILKQNKGAAEIHMMSLAECIWDKVNESTPKELKAGEWHIPFEDKINLVELAKNISCPQDYYSTECEVDYEDNSFYKSYLLDNVIKCSVGMAAQTSYTIIGKDKTIDYENLIKLHDRLITQNPPHSSPMEHCAKVMSTLEYYTNVKGVNRIVIDTSNFKSINNTGFGWCRNFRGFIPYRHIVETNGQESN